MVTTISVLFLMVVSSAYVADTLYTGTAPLWIIALPIVTVIELSFGICIVFLTATIFNVAIVASLNIAGAIPHNLLISAIGMCMVMYVILLIRVLCSWGTNIGTHYAPLYLCIAIFDFIEYNVLPNVSMVIGCILGTIALLTLAAQLNIYMTLSIPPTP